MEDFFSKEHLGKIFLEIESSSGSIAIGRDRVDSKVFKGNLSLNIDSIHRKIHDGTYRFSSYKEKLILKGAGKNPRVISIPSIRDRIVLRAILDYLNSRISISKKILPQQIVSGIVNNIDSYDSCIKLDIKGFYENINHDILVNLLKCFDIDDFVLNLIYKSITTPTLPQGHSKNKSLNSLGLPQGISISGALAEIYLHKFDAWISSEFKDIKYFRYVDDILILCNHDKCDEYSKAILKKIKDDYKLEIHDLGGKSNIFKLDESFEFLGYLFKGGCISVRDSTISKFEKNISNMCTKYKYDIDKIEFLFATTPEHIDMRKAERLKQLEWDINLKITGCIYDNRRYGWIFYFSQINDKSLLFNLDRRIRILINRFGVNNIKLKSLFKTHSILKDTLKPNKYIPNYSTEYTDNYKYKQLSKYLSADELSDANNNISYYYGSFIKKKISVLEKDLGSVVSYL